MAETDEKKAKKEKKEKKRNAKAAQAPADAQAAAEAVAEPSAEKKQKKEKKAKKSVSCWAISSTRAGAWRWSSLLSSWSSTKLHHADGRPCVCRYAEAEG